MKSCVSVLPLTHTGWRSELVRSVGCIVTTVLGDVERILFKSFSCLNCSSACPVTKTVRSDLFYTSTLTYVVAIIVQDTQSYLPELCFPGGFCTIVRWAGLPAVTHTRDRSCAAMYACMCVSPVVSASLERILRATFDPCGLGLASV